jgi:signal peptidase I
MRRVIIASIVGGIIITLVSGSCGGGGGRLTATGYGGAMNPTLVTGQTYTVKPYNGTAPSRGDIISYRYPGDTSRHFIHRVIGLAGETIEVKNGKVFVDGNPLDEPYVSSPMDYTYAPKTVPPNSYWVLGDNRSTSFDSHAWGTSCVPSQLCDFLSEENIIGKIDVPKTTRLTSTRL